MRTGVAIVIALGWAAAGCNRGTGYERPADRNISAIGAPAVGVGDNGLGHGQAVENGLGRATQASEPFPAPKTPQKFTEVAHVSAADANSITLRRGAGDELSIDVQPLTTITQNGKPVSVGSLREGSEVRASYVVRGGTKVAERIEVLHVAPPEQPAGRRTGSKR